MHRILQPSLQHSVSCFCPADGAGRHSPPAGAFYAEHQAPLTAEEADLEWQHQLAEQDGPLSDVDWFDLDFCLIC